MFKITALSLASKICGGIRALVLRRGLPILYKLPIYQYDYDFKAVPVITLSSTRVQMCANTVLVTCLDPEIVAHLVPVARPHAGVTQRLNERDVWPEVLDLCFYCGRHVRHLRQVRQQLHRLVHRLERLGHVLLEVLRVERLQRVVHPLVVPLLPVRHSRPQVAVRLEVFDEFRQAIGQVRFSYAALFSTRITSI